MIEIIAPNDYEDYTHGVPLRWFVAGGITGCPDWQRPFLDQVRDIPDVVAFNPRRADWVDSAERQAEQIAWEYDALQSAHVVSFWFPEETLCPITLYELGATVARLGTNGEQQIMVGTHPNYARRDDVRIQLALATAHCAPYMAIHLVHSVDDLARQMRDYFTLLST